MQAINSNSFRSKRIYLLILCCMFLNLFVSAQKGNKPVSPLSVGKDGHLTYSPDAMGNRIVDFSYCGYMGSNEAIPNVPVKVVVPVAKGDATLRIQSALDYAA